MPRPAQKTYAILEIRSINQFITNYPHQRRYVALLFHRELYFIILIRLYTQKEKQMQKIFQTNIKTFIRKSIFKQSKCQLSIQQSQCLLFINQLLIMGCERSQIYEEELPKGDPHIPTEIDNLITESRFMRKEDLIEIFTETFHRIRSEGPTDTKEQALPSINISKDGKILHISNQKLIKRRQQYTLSLKNDLDPRDKQLIIPYHFTIDISRFQAYIQGQQKRYSNMIKQSNQTNKMKMIGEYMETIKFTNSEEYEQLMSEIQDFLSNMCENVASATFRLLNEGKLTDNEAKAFASKNFLVNIHALMLQVKNAVKHFAKEEEVQDIIAKITTEVDQSMMRVLQSIIQHYPQAPAAGETARMREAIINVNRSQDQSNDLILNRDIRIDKYLRLNYGDIVNGYQNYTGFIMQVINSAINVTREYFSKQEDISVFQRFVQFSERLFFTSQHKYCKEALRKDARHHDEKNDKLVDYYLKVLDGEEIEVRDTKQIPKDRKKLTVSESLSVIKADYQEGLEKLRESHRYVIAQKIPAYVMPFSRNQLRGEKFAVGSSSILRIMTKWAQNLQQIFKKPQLFIKQRLHNYKSISNELFAPTDAMNRTLTQRVAAQYEAVKGQLAKLKTQNTLLQSYILSHNETGIDSYLKRFTQVRSASSQINASLIEIMHKYLCVLIHHLLKAGEKIDTGSGWENINLVVFKVNDLLRSKFQCNQSTFINVLHTLALLDRSREMEGRFRLVRLKNKLNEKDNNILINYMFLGRVQCELQLSVQDTKGKAKNYYDFNHFLYELIRGKFGAITQCAIIVSQHDSTVNSCRDDYYRPKKYQRRLPPKRTYDEQNGIQFKKVHQKDSSLFICSKCKQLMVNHNVQLFNCKEGICNQCLMAMEDPQMKLKNEKIRHYLHENLGKGVKKVKKYSQIQKDKYVLTLSSSGRNRDAIKLFRVWQHQKECKVFLLQITKDILNEFDSPAFQYQEFNYVDIKPLQQKKTPLKDLTYVFGSDTLAEMLTLHSIEEQGLARLQDLISCFEDFRVEKSLVEAIKFKQEILDLSADPKKLRKFQQLLQDEISKDEEGGEEGLNTTIKGTYLIKYTKYQNLQYNNLKKLHLTQLDIQRLPPNLHLLTSLTEISLQANKFRQITLSIFPKLKKINLNHNQLQAVDFQSLTRLSHIRLNDNKITKIDLTAHPTLSQLFLEENQLTEVAIRFNPKLECSLDNQKSEKCQVNVLFKPGEHVLCEQFNEALNRQLVAEERNRNNCEYIFAMQEQA